ncbi:Retinol dehydrogenase 13 [Coemansia sp. RSA 1813]|nr:Retinol dehydrogenase 13 [Coemansia sp. RSA 1646]KAJ1770451.1 Retinol dehydrogenase 13 [Coemansia sp. RSA 1843]KAJ2090243.1 Retinol dehydrogenase 13 [Coemansia sp. RSA 986]KAJ2212579.1 Retinol dehydrogenase 13 [Coemansia sp. RSA 487]KAJ2564261.1 Retinol dehydrogenase 13 [Coemansia sp. RSA 1813]
MWLGALVDSAEALALKIHRTLWLPSFMIVFALGFWETTYCIVHRFFSSETDVDVKINQYVRECRQRYEEKHNSQKKIAIVTGANGGIGMETAKALGRAGYTTILACRNSKRGQQALNSLEESTGLQGVFYLMELDLASFISIESFAKEFERAYGQLHLLVCNAGMAFNHYDTTYDGLESQFGTNYVGHYVLVNRLLQTMKRSGGARITVAASIAACMVRDIDYSRVTDVWRFDRFANYATSKLALLVFSNALARRLEGTGITVNAFHPGVVATSLYRNVLFTMLPGIDGLLRHWLWLDEKVGSVTSIYLALSSDLEGKTGGYYARELPAAAHPDAMDIAVQDRLCQFTDILISTNTHASTLLDSINASSSEA